MRRNESVAACTQELGCATATRQSCERERNKMRLPLRAGGRTRGSHGNGGSNFASGGGALTHLLHPVTSTPRLCHHFQVLYSVYERIHLEYAILNSEMSTVHVHPTKYTQSMSITIDYTIFHVLFYFFFFLKMTHTWDN